MKTIVFLACIAALGCGDDDSADSGLMDVGTSDVFGGEDAGLDASVDGALPDVGDESDASVGFDASEIDASEIDASEIDASPMDTGAADGRVVDAGDDSGPPDAGFDSGIDAGPTMDAGPPITCQVTGCSGQLCVDRLTASTCEFAPWYVCYRDAECELQSDGACAWTRTPSFSACLEENGAPE